MFKAFLFALITFNAIQSFAASLAQERALFLTDKEFSSLDSAKRTKYIQNVRKAIFETEKFYLKGIPVAQQKKWIDLFINEAIAQAWSGSKECVIGGRVSTVIDGRCSTKSLEAKCGDSGFLCGEVYGNDVCVPRTDITKISQLCYDKGSQNPASGEAISKAKEFYADLCEKAEKSALAGCRILSQRLSEAKEEVVPLADIPEQISITAQRPGAAPTSLQDVLNRKDLQQCVDIAEDKKCITGSMSVQLKTDAKGVQRAWLMTCDYGLLNNSRSVTMPWDFADFIKKNQNHPDVANLSVSIPKNGKAVKASIAEYILYLQDTKNATLSNYDPRGAEQLMKIAKLYNQDKKHNKCEAIQNYRIKNIVEEKQEASSPSSVKYWGKENKENQSAIEEACANKTTAQLGKKAPQAMRIDYEEGGVDKSMTFFPIDGSGGQTQPYKYNITYKINGVTETLDLNNNDRYNSKDYTMVSKGKSYKVKNIYKVHSSRVNEVAPNVPSTEATYCASFVRASSGSGAGSNGNSSSGSGVK